MLREEIMNQEVLKDGYLTEYEISRIQSLLLTGKDVHNLKGIEILKSLRYLYVGFCPVEEIDVSKCEKLQVLYCYNSSVTKINTSGCNSLRTAICRRYGFAVSENCRCWSAPTIRWRTLT